MASAARLACTSSSFAWPLAAASLAADAVAELSFILSRMPMGTSWTLVDDATGTILPPPAFGRSGLVLGRGGAAVAGGRRGRRARAERCRLGGRGRRGLGGRRGRRSGRGAR